LKTKEQTMIYKTLHRNLTGRATRTLLNTGVNSGAPEGKQFKFQKWYPSCYSCNRTELLLRRTEHMRGHLWHKYSV